MARCNTATLGLARQLCRHLAFARNPPFQQSLPRLRRRPPPVNHTHSRPTHTHRHTHDRRTSSCSTAGRLECTEQIDLMRIDRNQKRQQEEEARRRPLMWGGRRKLLNGAHVKFVSLLEENSRKIGNNQKSRDKKKGQQSKPIIKGSSRDIQE